MLVQWVTLLPYTSSHWFCFKGVYKCMQMCVWCSVIDWIPTQGIFSPDAQCSQDIF